MLVNYLSENRIGVCWMLCADVADCLFLLRRVTGGSETNTGWPPTRSWALQSLPKQVHTTWGILGLSEAMMVNYLAKRKKEKHNQNWTTLQPQFTTVITHSWTVIPTELCSQTHTDMKHLVQSHCKSTYQVKRTKTPLWEGKVTLS